jgi:hypothetical protein
VVNSVAQPLPDLPNIPGAGSDRPPMVGFCPVRSAGTFRRAQTEFVRSADDGFGADSVNLPDLLNDPCCSSHSGRRTFVINAARLVFQAGGSLCDVQQLAGHRSIAQT